jgi:hypothetical protein
LRAAKRLRNNHTAVTSNSSQLILNPVENQETSTTSTPVNKINRGKDKPRNERRANGFSNHAKKDSIVPQVLLRNQARLNGPSKARFNSLRPQTLRTLASNKIPRFNKQTLRKLSNNKIGRNQRRLTPRQQQL